MIVANVEIKQMYIKVEIRIKLNKNNYRIIKKALFLIEN